MVSKRNRRRADMVKEVSTKQRMELIPQIKLVAQFDPRAAALS